MSDEQPVTRRELDDYKDFQKELREAQRRETERVDQRIGLVERTAAADIEALRKDTDARFATAAMLREQDLTSAREQREEDQSTARAGAERKREWSWQMKLTVAGLAIAMAGLWAQALTGR